MRRALSTSSQWTEEVYHIHEVGLDYDSDVEKGISFYSPESKPVIEAAVQRAIEHGEPFDLELQFITAKGNHRWVHSIGKALQRDGKNNYAHLQYVLSGSSVLERASRNCLYY